MDIDATMRIIRSSGRAEIPSPKVPGETVRTMGCIEGYVMMRHKGCMPFLMTIKDVEAHLRKEPTP